MKTKVVFVGAGPGDPELLTLRGKREIENADVVIYAGSLVHRAILKYARNDAIVIDSYGKTREDLFALYAEFAKAGKRVVRLHTGDLSFYSAILERWLSSRLWTLILNSFQVLLRSRPRRHR
ncbi:MAG: SAM-dependent methyltransferase [Halobacteriota archaeon]